MNAIGLINIAAVGIFGMILSAGFCGICWDKKKRLIMAASMAGILLLQGITYFIADPNTVKYLYPAITHLPLVVVLCILNSGFPWSLVSVLTAYLCCQTRRWLALFVVALFPDVPMLQEIAELAITVPLLLFLLRFIAPSIRSVSHGSPSAKYLFGFVPALYYCFDYVTGVYTDLLSHGNPAVVEFMPFVCCIAYLAFALRVSVEERIRSQLEHTQSILNLQVSQAVREISVLREAQQKTKAYRHDLRHHMQHLLSCIENSRPEQAQAYIREICSETESTKIITFCENEPANLIFSAFAGRAKSAGISINIAASLPEEIPMSESDLCVLLSNALENALNSCRKIVQEGGAASIEVSAYKKNGKIFMQIVNSCDSNVIFSDGIPVSSRHGHGIGTQSICAIVERYSGIYSFSCREGKFILRVSL